MTTIDELIETAALAHLALDESELEKMLPAFDQMLEYFTIMKNADDDRAAFPNGFNDLDNSRAVSPRFFRSDDDTSTTDGSVSNSESLLNNAGGRDGRFIVIPNILTSTLKPAIP